ncbi:hypothetical protein CROQUDRAFT_95144 [Cronartium quercuum f. sp. fusiforme G11]|uniref:Tc1-like transposase DDE domain-containing protein n=1 Tax=Cronartium quercuum f. sp. fusiforme G11 TaxID=708437 RepID=A0A9P6T9P9_9BASI|nr:hypothetical protein CROQUDRAFT_95144 [Cronartium quercuum f. sp. fusiforme G11]
MQAEYLITVARLDCDQLVFVDESAIAWKRLYRDMGQAPVGQCTVHLNQVTNSSQYSVLPAILISGLMAVHVQEAGVKQQDFEAF